MVVGLASTGRFARYSAPSPNYVCCPINKDLSQQQGPGAVALSRFAHSYKRDLDPN